MPIDLGIDSYTSLTSYIDRPILNLDSSYSAGDLSTLKNHFILGNSKRTDSSDIETPITGYKISDTGLFVAE
jgi:hypothetical protein